LVDGDVYRILHARQHWLAAILLFSFLPTLTFLGHWDEILDGGAPEPSPASAIADFAAEQAEQIEHASHCHTNLGSCSAQPMPAGVGLLATHEALLGPPPSIFEARLEDGAQAPPGPALIPLLPPPRAA
jgi:hypothetical protein